MGKEFCRSVVYLCLVIKIDYHLFLVVRHVGGAGIVVFQALLSFGKPSSTDLRMYKILPGTYALCDGLYSERLIFNIIKLNARVEATLSDGKNSVKDVELVDRIERLH